MTHITPGSKMRREISIPGIPSAVSAEIGYSGISFWVKGSRKRIWLPWADAVAASDTPQDVPSHLYGKPLELLRHQASKCVSQQL